MFHSITLNENNLFTIFTILYSDYSSSKQQLLCKMIRILVKSPPRDRFEFLCSDLATKEVFPLLLNFDSGIQVFTDNLDKDGQDLIFATKLHVGSLFDEKKRDEEKERERRKETKHLAKINFHIFIPRVYAYILLFA